MCSRTRPRDELIEAFEQVRAGTPYLSNDLAMQVALVRTGVRRRPARRSDAARAADALAAGARQALWTDRRGAQRQLQDRGQHLLAAQAEARCARICRSLIRIAVQQVSRVVRTRDSGRAATASPRPRRRADSPGVSLQPHCQMFRRRSGKTCRDPDGRCPRIAMGEVVASGMYSAWDGIEYSSSGVVGLSVAGPHIAGPRFRRPGAARVDMRPTAE